MHPGITRLIDTGSISPSQARVIHDRWRDSVGDLWSQPELRAVDDDIQRAIDHLRGQLRHPIPFEEQEGGEVHG